MEKIKIGISVGDINGVGLEVIIKSLANKQIINMCIPVIYGSSKVVSYHKNIVGVDELQFTGLSSAHKLRHDKVNVVNCWQDDVNITLGKLTEAGGKFAHISLAQATNDLQEGLIDALVTAPFNKKAMQLANFQYPGHTEYLTERFGAKESLMLMVNDDLRVGLATNHLPISQVAAAITKEQVARKLKIMNKTLKKDFGIERPTIAVLALNPHAGDDGMLGDEEEKHIRPAIIEAKKNNVIAMGPYSADGFFGSGQHKKFDAVLAMYHDQGLVAFKALSFGEGVNYTAGLSCVRTSPDHGTGYDIAGTNSANHQSFLQAMFLAIDVTRNRKEYQMAHSNPIKKSEKATE